MRQWFRNIAAYFGNQWYERSVAVFVAIIAGATFSIFENYWWPETFAIAYYTLVASALIHLLLPVRLRLLRWLLQFIAAAAIVFRLARKEWIIAPPESARELGWWLEQHLAQLHPFIWIGLTVLLIHMVLGSWAVTRPRLFGVIGAGILVLTVADSFTPIWLWDKVAIVVFAGLIWLVLNHLAKLQRSHPDSWKDLFEYPIGLVSPVVIVLSLLMLVGVNMPSVAPLLQDPYTLWKNSRGEKVSVFLGDKAIARENAPLSAGNASSGYSRNDSVLGGGFDYDYSPMMTVTTTQKSYWRGESKDLYTGEGWEDAVLLSSSRTPAQAVRGRENLDETVDRSKAETTEVNQTVTMIREDVYPVLFGAAPVSRVEWIGGNEASFPRGVSWYPTEWELVWGDNGEYPQTYALTSNVTVLDEQALRGAQSAFGEAVQQARYTQLPDSLPQRVRQLALDITAEGVTDYDKAKLIESYLRLNYAYNNKPDLTKLSGQSSDFVDQFLFELWEGYCDYFSTAMTVMARSLGLPARWVKGFAPGTLPIDQFGPPGEFMDEMDINPTGAGTYTVRNSDAHSWVEIYFDGYGWIPFEPTAGFAFPYTMPEGEEVALPEFDPIQQENPAAGSAESDGANGVWAWVAAAVAVAAGGAWLLLRRRSVLGLLMKIRDRNYSANDLIVLETNKLLRMCRRRGLQREEHETLREAVQRWSQSRKRLRDDFRFVLDGFEGAKYGSVSATREEAERFSQRVKYLIGELK